MRSLPLPLAVVGVLAASAALAAPPPPPAEPGPFAGREAALRPPPGGPSADHPPPPPGAHVVIDREPNGIVRVDVHCAPQDTTRDCADIATRLLADTGAAKAGK